MTVFIKRNPIIGELPKESGLYTTNRGVMQFTSAYDRWYGLEPQWWLQEIELPSEEEIKKSYHENSQQYRTDLFVPIDYYTRGANFILNHLKSNTNGNQHR